VSRKTGVLAAVLVAVVIAAGVGVVLVIEHGRSTVPGAPPPAAVKTVAIRQTDLANTSSFSGTLGFGSAQTVKGAGEGIVTKLPEAGDTAERGKPLYSVNGIPVPVFFGDTPLYRKLGTPDLQGPDVAVVADNLAALGFRVGTRAKDRPKTAFTTGVSDALKKWQKSVGLQDTGTLDIGQIVVLSGPMRVNGVTAQLGDAANTPLLTVTPTAKVVTVPVDATEVGAIKAGVAATIVRPDAEEIPGRVTDISTAVDGGKDAGGGGGGSGPPKVNITVAPDNEHDLDAYNSAAVQIKITTETRAGVLAVPVGALVALREGGYAVQLPDGTLKAVRTGMFSKDLVEISGQGVSAGLQVVTTS
jgi:hypothetical protein